MARRNHKALKHEPYNKLKGVLAEKGLNQAWLAELLGLNPSTVNQKINGGLDFTFAEVDTICDALNVSSEIFRGKKVS